MRAAKAIAAQPYEGVERTLERLADRLERRRPPWPYQPTEPCEEQVHDLLGAPWPCEEQEGFERVWDATSADLGARGLLVGRGAFGGWDDADVRLGRLAWCLARHLRPKRIVETGVTRGLTTRVLLEALVLNGGGLLWSIDLPPLLEHRLAEETGAAVPEPLHERWTLLRGSSRRLLRGSSPVCGSDRALRPRQHAHGQKRSLRKSSACGPGARAGRRGADRRCRAQRRHRPVPAGTPRDAGRDLHSGDGVALIACLVKPGNLGSETER